jgi:hypothetical protein
MAQEPAAHSERTTWIIVDFLLLVMPIAFIGKSTGSMNDYLS